jgi:hypothetical protein
MNDRCFGNLPECECRIIYERLREAEKRVPEPGGNLRNVSPTLVHQGSGRLEADELLPGTDPFKEGDSK